MFRGLLTGLILIGAPFAVADDYSMPGTQPGELTTPLANPSTCTSCHSGFTHSPFDTWAGSMMANAQRDPIYLAALAVAEQEFPGSGIFCIRCHSPRGFLAGRAVPTDGSGLTLDDIEGVTCAFCHRMTPGPNGEELISNGQFFVSNDPTPQGTFPSDHAPHGVIVSDYMASSELCGVCHDVTNPMSAIPLERTYTEWALSAFPQEGTGCIDCHMPAAHGPAASTPGVPERTVHRHLLAGGNTFVPKILKGEYPELGRDEAYDLTIAAAEAQLRSAALLTVLTAPPIYRGQTSTVQVRVENLTGHKLPTGYPEGRRTWLEVRLYGGDGELLLHSGAYDYDEADRIDDDQLRTYEIAMGFNGVRGFNFLKDEPMEDTRIPPRGLIPTDDVYTIGRDYSQEGTDVLRHWDDAPYEVAIPADEPGPIRVEATLWYQTTSRPYIEWLRDYNVTNDAGDYLYEVWQAYGRSEPVAMAEISAQLPVRDPPPAPASDPVEANAGCGCATPGLAGGGLLLLLPVALGILRRRP